MLFFDPMYFAFVLPGMLLALWASWRVRANFSKYSTVAVSSGYTGAQAARYLLDQAGLHDVDVVVSSGHLSDHYDPTHRRLALSPDVYGGRSVAAVGIAAHEMGHALQHAEGYWPLWLRSALVPTANIGSSLGYIVMMLGFLALPYLSFAPLVVLGGVVLFSAVLVFQVVTLPVEFDATARAKRLLLDTSIVQPWERQGMDKVLGAAALTYVAAVVSSLLVILYYLYRAGFLGNSRD